MTVKEGCDMQTRAYRIRCQFNALHNLDMDHPEKMHAHTFRVTAYVENVGEELEKIDVCDRRIQEYFSRYKGCRMNDMALFRDRIPTIENMCEAFYEDLTECLLQEGVSLVKLELGDSPLAAYSVGSSLLAGSAYNRITGEQFVRYSRKCGEQRSEVTERE